MCHLEAQREASKLTPVNTLRANLSVLQESILWSWLRRASLELLLTALVLIWALTSRLWLGSKIPTNSSRVSKTSTLKAVPQASSSSREVLQVGPSQRAWESTLQSVNCLALNHSSIKLVWHKESRTRHLSYRASVRLDTGPLISSKKMEVRSPQ